ncbi:MAG TPA: hypothetical protein VD907_05955 [Verrucomicrobiae bacterium]|nr:hypothetical protein [Verrucomicrobiae bacterium]
MIASKPPFTKRCIALLGSWQFFAAVVGLFWLQAIWVAITASYPLIFDEPYHVGIIEIYAQQWGPLITAQSPESAVFGDITRYGSYLYHYLMSFPYRVAKLLTGDSLLAIVTVRVISTAFVAASLLFYRKTLLALGLSRATTNVAILLFSLIPLVSYIAGHVSYDTLQILGSAVFAYYLVRFIKGMGNSFVNGGALVTTGLLTSLVKFSFLPIFFIGVLGALVWTLYKRRKIITSIGEGYRALSVVKRILLIVPLVIGIGLFFERFGVNALVYKSLEAPCEKVRSVGECQQYVPWARNYELRKKQLTSPSPIVNRIEYTKDYWLPEMVNSLLIAGLDQDPRSNRYGISPGLPVLRIALWAFLFISLAALLLVGWRVFNTPASFLILIIVIGYLLVLWIRNYQEYVQLAFPVAVQGRYSLPVLLFIVAFSLQAIAIILRAQWLKVSLLVAGLLVGSQGGGIVTYLILQRDETHLPKSPLIPVDAHIKTLLKKVVKERLK